VLGVCRLGNFGERQPLRVEVGVYSSDYYISANLPNDDGSPRNIGRDGNAGADVSLKQNAFLRIVGSNRQEHENGSLLTQCNNMIAKRALEIKAAMKRNTIPPDSTVQRAKRSPLLGKTATRDKIKVSFPNMLKRRFVWCHPPIYSSNFIRNAFCTGEAKSCTW